MYYLYLYEDGNKPLMSLSDDLVLEEIKVNFKNRQCLKLKDYLWWVIALGKYKKMCVSTKSGELTHTSTVIGKCYKFAFLNKCDAEIGPCVTKDSFRGRGIYPAVISNIVNSGQFENYYMLVKDDNVASIK